MADLKLPAEITAKSRYESLSTDREPFLRRARQCAALTIPAIMPPQGHTGSSDLPTPYQSIGARGARTLASKLLLSLFPSLPFFNYKVDDQVLEDLGAKRGEIEKALSRRERAVVTELDTTVFRPVAFQAMLHLIVTGNVLVLVPPDPGDRARSFRLDQYVVRRDPTGRALEVVIREDTDLASLPDDHQRALMSLSEYQSVKMLEEAPVELYTHLYFDSQSKRWVVYQEAGGLRLSGDGTYKPEEMPFLALRLSSQPGEDYGRSYVEEYLGDLDSLEALSEALVEGSSAAARIVFLVKPDGTTSLKTVANAKTGDVKSGNAEDVTVMQLQKSQDLSIAKQQAEEIGKRLASAFLMHGSVQRPGERVTAEEIRFMASELDDALGGVYTLLAADFQLPCVNLFETRMMKRLKVPPIDPKIAQPILVTGLQAIGRGHDQSNMRMFLSEVIKVLTPEVAMRYFDPQEFLARAAAAWGIDTEGLLIDEETMDQNTQQAQAMQMLQALGPNAINQLGGMGNTALKSTMEATPADVANAQQAQE